MPSQDIQETECYEADFTDAAIYMASKGIVLAMPSDGGDYFFKFMKDSVQMIQHNFETNTDTIIKVLDAMEQTGNSISQFALSIQYQELCTNTAPSEPIPLGFSQDYMAWTLYDGYNDPPCDSETLQCLINFRLQLNGHYEQNARIYTVIDKRRLPFKIRVLKKPNLFKEDPKPLV